MAWPHVNYSTVRHSEKSLYLAQGTNVVAYSSELHMPPQQNQIRATTHESIVVLMDERTEDKSSPKCHVGSRLADGNDIH